ncbi:hypothetical protein ACFCVO_02180 [Agromyces sp. NPDC056379]
MPPIDEADERAIVISEVNGVGVAHPDGRLATVLERFERQKTDSSGRA